MHTAARIVRSALDHNITGEGGKAAFYFFLSLFPAILVIFSLTGYFGGDSAFHWITGILRDNLPAAGEDWIATYIAQVTANGRPSALSIGVLLALWAGSSFFAALGDGLNRMWDVRRPHPWWRRRLKALLLLGAGSVLLVGGTLAVLFGPLVVQATGAGAWANLIRWPLAFVLIAGLLGLVYFVMPDRDQRGAGRSILAGAVVGSVLWLLGTAAFRLYVDRVADFQDLYGVVGSVIVLQLWLFITAIAILLGGEVAEQLEERRRGRHGD
jgi:membrane protein